MDCGITMVHSCLGVTGTLLMATGLLSVRSQGVRVSQVLTRPRIVTWCRGSWHQLSTPPLFISWLCLLSDYLAGLSYPLSLRTPYSWCHLLDLRRQAALIVLPIMQLCPPCCWWIRAGFLHSQLLSPCCYFGAPLWNSISWFQPWPLEDDLHWLSGMLVSLPQCCSHQPSWGFQLAGGFLTYIGNPPQPAYVSEGFDPWPHCNTVVQFTPTLTIQSSADSTAWGQSHPQNYAQISSPVFGVLGDSTLGTNFVWGSQDPFRLDFW